MSDLAIAIALTAVLLGLLRFVPPFFSSYETAIEAGVRTLIGVAGLGAIWIWYFAVN